MIPVTLACIDCVDPALAVAAMRTGDSLPFARRLLLSDERPDEMPDHIQWRQIPRLDSLRDYNRFCIQSLHRYIDTPHVLTVHSDGYFLRPELWRDEWIEYDYIGAPWPADVSWSNKSRVGNSGFCLRSRRLLQATARHDHARRYPKSKEGWRDDVRTCLDLHDALTAQGLRFAPLGVAARFSLEHLCDDLHQSVGAVFGFHGCITPQTKALVDAMFRRVSGGKLRLIVNYYNDIHLPRRIELDETLRANAGPGLFDEIIVLAAADTHLPAYRLVSREWVEGRPTYAQHLFFANRATQKFDVNVIANADIEFDPATIGVLHQLRRGEFWCLSRWDGRGRDRPPPEYRWCQDAWAWRGPCRAELLETAGHPLGYPGCENRLAYLAHAAGYRVRNPSLSLKTFHNHDTGYRRYPATHHAVKCVDRIPWPYLYVDPHAVGETARIRIDKDFVELPDPDPATMPLEQREAVLGGCA